VISFNKVIKDQVHMEIWIKEVAMDSIITILKKPMLPWMILKDMKKRLNL